MRSKAGQELKSDYVNLYLVHCRDDVSSSVSVREESEDHFLPFSLHLPEVCLQRVFFCRCSAYLFQLVYLKNRFQLFYLAELKNVGNLGWCWISRSNNLGALYSKVYSNTLSLSLSVIMDSEEEVSISNSPSYRSAICDQCLSTIPGLQITASSRKCPWNTRKCMIST